MLHFKRKTSTTFAFVCFLHNPVDVLFRHNFSVELYKVERVITGHACTFMLHAIYKITEFFFYKGFTLIEVHFNVHYSVCVCYQLFQC